MEWYEEPYKGGPMVVVDGFPRSLYPPDAVDENKAPSPPGPDVMAYKRTVCRAQRWLPWDPDNWDEYFNNKFSHGRGTGMVKDSGVAGVQRQQGIEPTGWIGASTFNLLRSIRVPTGPNEGQMAMDSVAISLINEAYKIWHPSTLPEPHPDPTAIQLPTNFTATHMTAGLDGYPAIDVFGKAGQKVLCPSDGSVRRLSGRDPIEGGVPGSAYGWSMYIVADHADYYLTHFGSRAISLNQEVKKGQLIGTICDAAVAGMPTSSSHIHEGKREL